MINLDELESSVFNLSPVGDQWSVLKINRKLVNYLVE